MIENNIVLLLRDPRSNSKLKSDGNALVAENNATYKTDGNLINFLHDEKNKATEEAASFRWDKSKRLETDSGFIKHQLNDFLLRYGFDNIESFKIFLKDVKTIAEIGAGEGRMVDWFLEYSNATIFALELSDSVYYLKEKYKNNERVVVVKADALYHPFADGSIDLLSCEQAIHHTDNPGKIFSSLCKSLSRNGKVILAVYAKKSAIREKFDTIIRDTIAKESSERKFDLAKKITEIGQILSDMKVDVEVPKSFSEFGNLAGEKMSLQRFLYFSVFKCFWNDDFSFEKSVEFNHDWYSYPICNKTSLEEGSLWFIKNGLGIDYIDSNASNINIRGSKK